MLLECLRSTIAERYGFWLILQLCTFVLSFSPLPPWFASLSPTQYPFASFSPKERFMIQGNPGLRAVTWRGSWPGKGGSLWCSVTISPPSLGCLVLSHTSGVRLGTQLQEEGLVPDGEEGAEACEPMGVLIPFKHWRVPGSLTAARGGVQSFWAEVRGTCCIFFHWLRSTWVHCLGPYAPF